MKISETFNSLYKAEAAGWKKQKNQKQNEKKSYMTWAENKKNNNNPDDLREQISKRFKSPAVAKKEDEYKNQTMRVHADWLDWDAASSCSAFNFMPKKES